MPAARLFASPPAHSPETTARSSRRSRSWFRATDLRTSHQAAPLPSGGANTTPSYQNGPGKLTIGSAANPFDLEFQRHLTCTTCNYYVEIGGATPGTEYDQVVVNGNLAIGTGTVTRGVLTVGLINGYTRPAVDTSFEILAATSHSGLGFTTANLPDAGLLERSVLSSLFAKLGACERIGHRRLQSRWRRRCGRLCRLAQIASFVWRSRRLRHLPPQLRQLGPRRRQRLIGNTAVPEPGTAMLLIVGLMTMACPRRVLLLARPAQRLRGLAPHRAGLQHDAGLARRGSLFYYAFSKRRDGAEDSFRVVSASELVLQQVF